MGIHENKRQFIGMTPALTEVRRDAFIQIFGLANIDYFSRLILKEIDSWFLGNVFYGITIQHLLVPRCWLIITRAFLSTCGATTIIAR